MSTLVTHTIAAMAGILVGAVLTAAAIWNCGCSCHDEQRACEKCRRRHA